MQKPQHGGLALLGITLYYHAAIFRSMLQWWNPQNKLNWYMEGIGIRIPLSEGIFFSSREHLKSSNLNVKIILRIWFK